VLGRMSKPTGIIFPIVILICVLDATLSECFYHKDGLWYYAGSYKAFKLDTLSTKEWTGLAQDVRIYSPEA
jgi:hypothetical protein